MKLCLIKEMIKRTLARLLSSHLPVDLILRPDSFSRWEERGVHITPVHFYQPIPVAHELPEELFTTPSTLPGLKINLSDQWILLDRLREAFLSEWKQIPFKAGDNPHQYYFAHGEFSAVDAEILYAMVRSEPPGRIIEVGSGFSTRLIAQALRKNREEGHPACDYTVIDPCPRPEIKRPPAEVSHLIEKRVETVGLDLFSTLKNGDILFLDSSHVLKTGSDVWFEVLEILPRLAPGVRVHVHDIFWPMEYPKSWLTEKHLFWNEQYLLQAFLAFNSAFSILWTGQALLQEDPRRLRAAFPSCSEITPCPGSVWFRRNF